MITLTVSNSLSRIEGLSGQPLQALRELLSYSEEGAYFSGRDRPNKRYLIDKKGFFPTGLLYIVDKFLQPMWEANTVKRVDLRVRPNSGTQYLFTLNLNHTPYPEQVKAAHDACVHGRGIIVAPTGLGKSIIIALLIHRLQVPTLVVVPSLELKTQLRKSLKAAFGTLDYILVENVDALDPTKPLIGYHAVIVDELHHSASATYRKLNKTAWSGIYYRFGLTATPFRSKDSERLLFESFLSQVVCRIEYQDAVANKRIVPLEAYYVDLPVQEMKGNPNSWPAVYSELVVNNEYRNNLIAKFLQTLNANNIPTLCLVKEIRHGEILADVTGFPFANGQDGNTRERILEFSLGETKSLIGTTGVIGEGVDLKPCEWVIIACGGKSKTQFMQNCGRSFRVYPGKESSKIILFRDASHPWLIKHFNAHVKYLKEEYGVKAAELQLP